MKGGQTPIHIMRVAPSDYVNDPWVKLAVARGDSDATTFYHLFLFYSWMEGGSLSADPELLAAVLGMKPAVVKKSLEYWSAPGCGLIKVRDGRAFNPRVHREVAEELEFRGEQAVRGGKGGRAAAAKRSLERSLEPPLQRPEERPPQRPYSPPSPSPSPSPAPAPAPSGGSEASDGLQAPPLAASTPGPIPHDPTDPIQRQIVARCVELARKEADRDGRQATDEDVRNMLVAVSVTPKNERSLTDLRGANQSWLLETLRASVVFEAELGG